MATMQRNEDGTLPAFAWPGGYTLIYYTRDGETVCADCANREVDDSQAVIGQDIYWEGPALDCGDCGKVLESSYGDPTTEEIS